MKIKDLIVGRNVDSLEARVIDKSEPRRVMTRFGRELTVTTAKLEDDTGSINISLWGRDGDKVKVGDRVEIKNAFVKEFRGEKQLTLGRRGVIRVL